MPVFLCAAIRFVRAITVHKIDRTIVFGKSLFFCFTPPVCTFLPLFFTYYTSKGYVKVGNKGGDSYTASVVTAPSVCPETGGRMKVQHYGRTPFRLNSARVGLIGCVVQSSSMQRSVIYRGTAERSAVRYSTVSTVQCATVQCSTE